MRLAIAFAAMLSGCASQDAASLPMPGQDEAVSLLWSDALGMADEAPAITWVDGEKCKDLPLPAIPLAGGAVCASGWYALRRITLVRSESLAQSGLSHELLHAFLERVTGDADGAHARPEWPYVVEMNAALRRHGL